MNTLILVNTYSQLIIALQLRKCIFKNDNVSVLVTDFAALAQNVSKKLSNEHLFDDVFYVECRKIEPRDIIGKIKSFREMLLGSKIFFEATSKKWDKFLYYNRDTISYSLYRELIKMNKYLEPIMYEEGILSYSFETKNRRMLAVEKIWKLFGIKGLRLSTKKFYCFYPDFYKGKLTPVKIPKLKEKDTFWKSIMQKLFSIDTEEVYNTYNGKFVFFTGVYDFEGGNSIGEIDIVEKISRRINKENFIVKVHPRDDIQRFVNRNIPVAKSSSIPWEAIQLSCSINNVVFLTVVSGSVLMPNLMIEHPIDTVLLFKMCDIHNNYSAQKNYKDLLRIIKNIRNGNSNCWLSVANDAEDVFNINNAERTSQP